MDNLLVIAIRFALYADLMALTGLVAFSLYALRREERAAGVLPLALPVLTLSVAGFLFSGLGMIVLVASMMGTSLLSVDTEAMREIITQSAIGTAGVVRMLAMVAAIAFALILPRQPAAARWGLLASASLALATLVWTGHAGATEGPLGTLHRASDIVHMIAAAIWLGGIAAFIWLLFVRPERRHQAPLGTMHRALEQFSVVGTICVALIVASGLINSYVLVGPSKIALLPVTPYGRLLIAKLVLFLLMLMLAAANRWRHTPSFGGALATDGEALALRKLRISLVAEGAAALAILALVAWFGTLEPTGMAV